MFFKPTEIDLNVPLFPVVSWNNKKCERYTHTYNSWHDFKNLLTCLVHRIPQYSSAYLARWISTIGITSGLVCFAIFIKCCSTKALRIKLQSSVWMIQAAALINALFCVLSKWWIKSLRRRQCSTPTIFVTAYVCESWMGIK